MLHIKTVLRFSALGAVGAFGLAGIAVAAIAPPPPAPDEGTTFDLFVGDQYTYDANLYRVPANFGPISPTSPNATRGDRINTVSAGGTGQWIVGRQDFDLTLRLDNSRFAHNTALDNTGGDAALHWDWQVGPYFSGQAGAEFNKAQAGFAEERYIGRDLVNNTNYFGTARYQVGPRWAILGGIREARTVHQAELAAFNDFRTKSGSVAAEYATGVADTFTLEYLYTSGIYPQNFTFNAVQFNRNFKEDIYRGKVKYAVTAKVDFEAYAGYITHNLAAQNGLPTAIFGDFSGDIWRATLTWRPTEKTQLVAAGWHELHAFLVNASNYFVSKGESLAPTWLPTEKVTIAFVASREDQDYVAIQSVLGLAAVPRFDRVTAEQINVFYVPRPRWTLNFFLRHENRSSNDPGYTYVDTLGNLSADL